MNNLVVIIIILLLYNNYFFEISRRQRFGEERKRVHEVLSFVRCVTAPPGAGRKTEGLTLAVKLLLHADKTTNIRGNIKRETNRDPAIKIIQ